MARSEEGLRLLRGRWLRDGRCEIVNRRRSEAAAAVTLSSGASHRSGPLNIERTAWIDGTRGGVETEGRGTRTESLNRDAVVVGLWWLGAPLTVNCGRTTLTSGENHRGPV